MTVFKGVPPELQAKLTKRPNILTGASGFAYNIAQRLELEEVEVSERAKDGKLQARLTYAITVEDGACASPLYDTGTVR